MTAMETTLRAKLGKKPDSLLFAWLADELRLQHNLDAALPLVEEGLSHHPDFLPGLLVRGKVLYELNALEEAENVFRKVYRRDPFCLSALRHLAQIATKLNRTSQAEQYWRMLQAMDPLDSSLPSLPALRATAHMPRPVPLEEDPFAQLKPAAPLEISQEGPSALELAGALDAALAGSPSGPTVPEFFPADDDSSVTSSDVGSAISSLFGSSSAKAPPQPEAEIGSSSPFSLPLPPSARPEAPPPPANAEVNSALDALFGDEEKILTTPPPTEISETLGAQDMDSALDALFGGEAAEAPAQAQAVEASQGEQPVDLHSALDSLFGDEDEYIEGAPEAMAPTPPVLPAADDAVKELSSSLDQLFGDEDTAPGPISSVQWPAEQSEIQQQGAPVPPDLDSLLSEQLSFKQEDLGTVPDLSDLLSPAPSGDLPDFGTLPTLEGNAPDLQSLLSEQLSDKGAVPDFSADLDAALQGEPGDEEIPGLESLKGNAPEIIQPSPAEPGLEVSGALDELFGDMDDLPEEAPAKTTAPLDLDSLLFEQLSDKGAVPDFSADLDAALQGEPGDEEIPGLESLKGNAPEIIQPSPAEPGLEVSGALDELFGDMDDLPEEAPAKTTAPLDLESLLSEQLSSKGDVPDFSADLDAALMGVPGDEEIPGLESLKGNAPEIIQPSPAEPGLEVSGALDELFGDMDDLPEEAPAKTATPLDLDSLLSEQLSSKGDVPDFTEELDAALSYTDSTPGGSPMGIEDLDFGEEEPLPPPAALAPAPVQAAPSAEKAFTDDVADAFSSLFSDLDNDVPEEKPGATALPMAMLTEEEPAPASGQGVSEVSSALDLLFADEDDSPDGLLGASSDAALRHQLTVDPKAPVSGKEEPVPQNPTPTLAEIYLEQGLVSKAIATYRDLVAAKPEDAALRARLEQIEKMARREG